MRRYREAVTLAIALAGCADQRQVYSAAVAHAQDRWAAACGVRPVPASVVLLDVERFDCGPVPGAAGCTDHEGHVTLATRTTAPRDGLILHELGHVLGGRAPHLATGVAGVMTASMSSNQWRPYITPADLDAVAVCTVRRPECGVLRRGASGD